MSISIKNSDFIGACANVLCMLHCIATPFLFISQAHTTTISTEIPFLWNSANYFFLTISFIAVSFSIKNSTKSFVKVLLGFTWLVLAFFVINDGLNEFYFPEYYTYISASLLSLLHVYNLKYCTCKDDGCCVH